MILMLLSLSVGRGYVDTKAAPVIVMIIIIIIIIITFLHLFICIFIHLLSLLLSYYIYVLIYNNNNIYKLTFIRLFYSFTIIIIITTILLHLSLYLLLFYSSVAQINLPIVCFLTVQSVVTPCPGSPFDRRYGGLFCHVGTKQKNKKSYDIVNIAMSRS